MVSKANYTTNVVIFKHATKLSSTVSLSQSIKKTNDLKQIDQINDVLDQKNFGWPN